MKTFANLFLITLLSSAATIAQELETSAVTMHRKSVFRHATIPNSTLKTPGMPATRDYTRPITNNNLNSSATNTNPSLNINPVFLNRRPAYSSVGYQTFIDNQQNPNLPGTQTQNGGLLNTLVPTVTAIPATLLPGLPVNLPAIVNPIVPIVTPVINPIITPLLPIVTPILNPILPIKFP